MNALTAPAPTGEMHRVDGSQGEGGGQILRTTLAISMWSGRPVHIVDIRAGRSRPGLLRQHLTGLRAAQQIACAEVQGDELGSSEVVFRPGAVNAGHYRFAVGTAGSTTLVWQTILPALLAADGPSVVELEGGTHAAMAPSLDFIRHAFVPAVARMGVRVEITPGVHGFFPMGGGRWRVRVEPWTERHALRLLERGKAGEHEAVVTSANLRANIAERELRRVGRGLGWGARALRSEVVESPGPGNIVSLRLRFAKVCEVIESHGEKRLSAERVADRAVQAARRYLAADWPVGPHLADQLMVLMALGAGGEYRTGPLTEHARTNAAVIEQLLGNCVVGLAPDGEGTHVTVRMTA